MGLSLSNDMALSLPTPRYLEEKTDFIARFQSHQRSKEAYRDFGRRHLAAEQAWTLAKADSIVSFAGFRQCFLVLE